MTTVDLRSDWSLDDWAKAGEVWAPFVEEQDPARISTLALRHSPLAYPGGTLPS